MVTKLCELKGILLQRERFSDSRWRLSLFTETHGRMTVWYRASSKKPQPYLTPFVPLWVSLTTRQGWQHVKKIELAAPPFHLLGEALFAGLYLNELIAYLFLECEPHLEVYNAYMATLKALQALEQPNRLLLEILLRRFEWQLLQSLGYGISLKTVAFSQTLIQPNGHYRCIPKTGFVECATGFSGATLLAMAAGEWGTELVLKQAKVMMRILLDDLLAGRVLKTRELFRGVYASTD